MSVVESWCHVSTDLCISLTCLNIWKLVLETRVVLSRRTEKTKLILFLIKTSFLERERE